MISSIFGEPQTTTSPGKGLLMGNYDFAGKCKSQQ
ncbi:hypothetical protein SPLC1_S371040 [Arthrospira platensis C1]|nr:hypothetical protein SPLC1_S371040 [Arthrospira platensis C1]